MADDQCAEDTNEQAEEPSTNEFITVDSVMENDAEELVDEEENGVMENDAEEDVDEEENGVMENDAEELVDGQENGVMENDTEDLADEQENGTDDTSKPEDSTIQDRVCQRWMQKVCHMGTACSYRHPTERLNTCAQFRWGECRQTDCAKVHFSSHEEYQFYKTGALPAHNGDIKETGSKCKNLPAIQKRNIKRNKDIKKDRKFVCKAWLDGDDTCPIGRKNCESKHPLERLILCKEYRDLVECPRGEDCTLKHFTYSEELQFYRHKRLPEHAGDVKVVGVIFAGVKQKNGEDLQKGVCWMWRQGEKCTREKCSLLHPAEEDRDKYPLVVSQKKICFKWRTGRCDNPECLYKHPPTRLKICQSFLKKQSCPLDTGCANLHMTRLEETTFYRTGVMPLHHGDPMLAAPDDAAQSYYGKTTAHKQKGYVSWLEV